MTSTIKLLLLVLGAAYISAVLCQQAGQQQRNSAAVQHRKQLPTTPAHNNKDKHWLGRGQRTRIPCPKGNLQCKVVSDMMAQLEFQPGFGPKVNCTCAQFEAGVCFAPGCFPCAKSCFANAPPELANSPGPLGTGLLCSTGCQPCCQTAADPNKAANSTCELPVGGCS